MIRVANLTLTDQGVLESLLDRAASPAIVAHALAEIAHGNASESCATVQDADLAAQWKVIAVEFDKAAKRLQKGLNPYDNTPNDKGDVT